MNNRRSFIVGIKSTKLSSKEKNFIKRYRPWGIILFTRNIKNIQQTQKLTSEIRKIFNDKKYPILIDQEGGKVNRLNKFISLDNLTSEFFGKIYMKNKREFKVIFKLYIDNIGIKDANELKEFLWLYRNSYDNIFVQLKSELMQNSRDLIISRLKGRNKLLVKLKEFYQKF